MEEVVGIPGIQTIVDRDFPPDGHPYRILERAILHHIDADHTVLDVGCGRRASTLMRLKGRARQLIGVDLIDIDITDPELLLINADVCSMNAVSSAAVDLAYSCSVMEHIKDVPAAFSEINRVLKPGGKYLFLTPNAWDYASVIAYLVPNRFHARITSATEGRHESDAFPTFYRANTFRRIRKLAECHDFELKHFEYLGQYPCYFSFNGFLFYIGAHYEKFLERHRSLHFLRGWIFCILAKRVGPGQPTVVA